MEFEEYLNKKNIDATAFAAAEPNLFEEWKQLFLTIHPKSFTAQKLYLINFIRRKYILNDKNKKNENINL